MGRDTRRRQERIQKKNKKALASENPTMVFEIQPQILASIGLIITTQLSITEDPRKFFEAIRSRRS